MRTLKLCQSHPRSSFGLLSPPHDLVTKGCWQHSSKCRDPAPVIRLVSILIVHWRCNLASRNPHFLSYITGWQGSWCAPPNLAHFPVQINGATGRHHQRIVLASAGFYFPDNPMGPLTRVASGTLGGITNCLLSICLPADAGAYSSLPTIFPKFPPHDHFWYKDFSTKTKTLALWEPRMDKKASEWAILRPVQPSAMCHVIYQYREGDTPGIRHKEGCACGVVWDEGMPRLWVPLLRNLVEGHLHLLGGIH